MSNGMVEPEGIGVYIPDGKLVEETVTEETVDKTENKPSSSPISAPPVILAPVTVTATPVTIPEDEQILASEDFESGVPLVAGLTPFNPPQVSSLPSTGIPGGVDEDTSTQPVTLDEPNVEIEVTVPQNGLITEVGEPESTVFDIAVGDLEKIIVNYDKHMVGQNKLKETLLIGLLTGGHILLESVPGLAKTTAAQTLALSVHGKFNRIQCTPDLLPSDIIGTEIFDQKTGSFKTELGPVHANFVLLDEINRSSAKTQSAMLEAMQEKQTSIGGEVFKLPTPFQVIATQNPIEHEGTYPLPEAQLDRFVMKDILTYSTPEEEYEILKRYETGVLNSGAAEPVVDLETVTMLQETVKNIYVNDTIRKYIVNIVTATRNMENVAPEYANFVEYGASPRATIALLICAKAVALINKRDHVIPEDVKTVAERVLQHRIILTFDAPVSGISTQQIVAQLLDAIPTP